MNEKGDKEQTLSPFLFIIRDLSDVFCYIFFLMAFTQIL